MLREFTDAKGMAWRVWDVYPHMGRSTSSTTVGLSPALSAFPSRELAEGWLVFECDDEKRRLAPIPPEWETCEPGVLEELCARAGYITRLTPPAGGTASETQA